MDSVDGTYSKNSVLNASSLCPLGPIPEALCWLSPVTESHPVQALLESYTVLSGCASKGTISNPQEVHIINLKCVEEDPCQSEKEVCMIYSIICSAMFPGSTILYLGLLF